MFFFFFSNKTVAITRKFLYKVLMFKIAALVFIANNSMI